MCGRYRLANAKRFAELNEVRLGGEFPARYNVAPTQLSPVLLDERPDELVPLRWGLIPSWAKDSKIASSLINARCETVPEKPAFRSAYKRRRCLVPADGFYEWAKRGTAKVPHDFTMANGEPFAFAGLWEVWRNPEERARLIVPFPAVAMRAQPISARVNSPKNDDSSLIEPLALLPLD